LDTNAAWKSRRQAFRHAFTTTSLKHYEKHMNILLDKMCCILDRHVKEKTVLPIDDLFAKFTLDVIYTVGFELEKNFMENEVEYRVSVL
jgi:cytochrome P450